MKEENLVITLIDTLKAQIKRQFIILLVVILCWISTIGIFIWYINQYDFETESTAIMETDNDGNITTGDIDNG